MGQRAIPSIPNRLPLNFCVAKIVTLFCTISVLVMFLLCTMIFSIFVLLIVRIHLKFQDVSWVSIHLKFQIRKDQIISTHTHKHLKPHTHLHTYYSHSHTNHTNKTFFIILSLQCHAESFHPLLFLFLFPLLKAPYLAFFIHFHFFLSNQNWSAIFIFAAINLLNTFYLTHSSFHFLIPPTICFHTVY